MFAYGIFKVIYAPHKAFREIIQKPTYIGPLLIMLFFTAANMGFAYTIISKTYVEQTLPTAEQLDMWTENYTLWKHDSKVTATNNYEDYISGINYNNATRLYYGNKSIEFATSESTQIQMWLDDIGSINCSGPEGYKDLSIRIKLISPEIKPKNVTLYLFSVTPSDFFSYDLMEKFSNVTINIWNNITIPLGNEKWLKNGANAEWNTIKGLKLEFTWPTNVNIRLLIDGLFFRGVFRYEMVNINNHLLNSSISAVTRFIIHWVLLSGLIYIMTRGFGAKTVWRPLLILVGFTLMTLFVQSIINTAAFSITPPIYYKLELMGGVRGESEIAYNRMLEEVGLAYQITSYVPTAIMVWSIFLCAIAIRLLTEFSWSKSLIIGFVAYFVSMLAETFLLGL